MGIDCRTIIGVGVVVDIDLFLQVMGISDLEWEGVIDLDDPWQYISKLGKKYGSEIAFMYNGYDEMNSVFITTATYIDVEGATIIQPNLAKLYDGIDELIIFINGHFPASGVPVLTAYSYTT